MKTMPMRGRRDLTRTPKGDQAKIKNLLSVCRRRLDGESIQSIADDMGLTRSRLCDSLSQFPNGKDYVGKLDRSMSNETCMRVYELYLNGYTQAEIRDITGLEQSSVSGAFAALRDHRHPLRSGIVYPNLDKWFRGRGKTLRQVSMEARIPLNDLRAILKGKKEASDIRWRDLSAYTGLSVEELKFRGDEET